MTTHCPQAVKAGVTYFAIKFAVALLMLALFGRSINEFAQALSTPFGMIGLTGQVLFGLIPVIQMKSKTQLTPWHFQTAFDREHS